MTVALAAFPQLRAICWNRRPDDTVDGAEALALYERNWRHVQPEAFTLEEQALLDALVARYGGGVLNV